MNTIKVNAYISAIHRYVVQDQGSMCWTSVSWWDSGSSQERPLCDCYLFQLQQSIKWDNPHVIFSLGEWIPLLAWAPNVIASLVSFFKYHTEPIPRLKKRTSSSIKHIMNLDHCLPFPPPTPCQDPSPSAMWMSYHRSPCSPFHGPRWELWHFNSVGFCSYESLRKSVWNLDAYCTNYPPYVNSSFPPGSTSHLGCAALPQTEHYTPVAA